MKVHFEKLESKSLLNRVQTPAMPFEWSINPYRGCQHGCSFCYARSTHSFFDTDSGDTFQSHIFIKEQADVILERQLQKLLKSKGASADIGRIAIGTATDPYQPVEAKALLTRKCLEVLARYQIPTSITTRSPLILRDADLLSKVPITSVNISLNTLDAALCRRLEPATPHPMQRLKTVQALSEQGIPVGVFMAPILPFLTDSDDQLHAIIEAAAGHGASFVMSSFLRLATNEVKVWFFETLRREFPDVVSRYGRLFNRSTSVPPSYRAPIQSKIENWLKTYGFQEGHFLRKEGGAQQPASKVLGALTQPLVQNEPVQLTFSFPS